MIPPPPRVPQLEYCMTLNEEEQTLHESIKNILDRWFRLHPERGRKPDKIYYKHVIPMLQRGPTCGLVAIAMVLTILPRNWTLQELLEDVQFLGFSRSGEMFSVDDMAEFSNHVLGDYFKVEMLSGGLVGSKTSVVESLCKGKTLFLVPYDSDRNHSPACLKGHKAHWALICGIVFDKGDIFVLARQGKSKHINIWDFDELHDSNCNLSEIAPSRLNDNYTYYNLKESMAGKFIKLEERTK